MILTLIMVMFVVMIMIIHLKIEHGACAWGPLDLPEKHVKSMFQNNFMLIFVMIV